MRLPARFKNSNGLVVRKHHLKTQGDSKEEIKEKWAILKTGLEQICNQNASSLFFQDLHRAAFIIVRANEGTFLYNETEKTLKNHIKGLRDKLMQHSDSTFLRNIQKEWSLYKVSIERVRDIYMYMDRAYAPQHKKPLTYNMGVQLFGKEVFDHKDCKDRIMNLILDWIKMDRNGERLKQETNQILKSLTTMMVEIDEKLYLDVFEKQFLLETKIFYTKIAASSFENDATIVYLEKILSVLKDELHRANNYMYKTTPSKLRKIIEETMIEEYKERIITKSGSGCQIMLENWKYDELKTVYTIVGKVKHGLLPLQNLVRRQCIKQGEEIITSEELDENPIDMIQTLLNLYGKYQELLDKSFSTLKNNRVLVRNTKFSKIVKEAWDHIIKSIRDNRFEEYLSLFIDSKLKKGKQNLSSSEFDTIFKGVIRLLHHSVDKDMFEQYYKLHLSKRLLSQKSQSDDAEKNILGKLKSEFGYAFTSKLEGMFNDMKTSKNLQIEYESHVKFHNIDTPFDISVTVLTSGFWGSGNKISVNIPKQIRGASDLYTAFYTDKFSSRELNWQLNLGTADVRANGFSKPYELNVNSLQMIILLLFNDNKQLSFQQISDEMHVPFKQLSSSLLALTLKSKSHGRILKKSNEDGTKKLTTSSIICPNEEFLSKLVKVKVSPIVFKQNREQKKETIDMINEERRTVLDSVIVRIMKMYKNMRHQQLMMEVTKQVQTRFQPIPSVIKKCIESLISREYIRRDEEERGLYHYIA